MVEKMMEKALEKMIENWIAGSEQNWQNSAPTPSFPNSTIPNR
jgi:hypothetical protein